MNSEARLGSVKGGEGMELVWRVWDAPSPEAALLLVHGLGEHAGRYEHLAGVLAAEGISVLGFDLRGHGLSEGPRGDITAFPRFLEDLLAMEEVLDREVSAKLPRFLLGHSMGGLIALQRLKTLGGGFAGGILSAPWLAVARPRWARGFGRGLGWLFPRMPFPNGIGPQRLTRDPEMALAWKEDPLVHSRVTGGLFREAERVQEELIRGGMTTSLPLLFLLPGADRVVDTRVSEAFARGIVGDRVEVEVLEGGYHEPFNDVGRAEVFRRVADWLGRQIAPPV